MVKQLIELNKPNFDEKKSTKTIVKVSVDGDLVADSKALAYATDNVGKEVSIGTDTMLTAFRLLRARDVIKELEIVFIRGYVMGGPGMSGPLTDVVSVDKNGSLASWPINDPITNANMDMTMELVGWKTGKVT